MWPKKKTNATTASFVGIHSIVEKEQVILSMEGTIKEELLQCDICYDCFKPPVRTCIPCGHSFCQVCLQQWRSKTCGGFSCPTCCQNI